MYAAATSVALVGGDVRPVEVQVHIGRPQEAFKLSGLPDTALREAKDRVRAAVVSSGVRFPNRTVTVNLAPADLHKSGTDFDLAIALGILAANRDIPPLGGTISVGELALDGRVQGGTGSIGGAVLSARSAESCLVPVGEASSVSRVPGSRVLAVTSLADAVEKLRLGLDPAVCVSPVPDETEPSTEDLAEVLGQPMAVRAIEVAAAGGHHLLFHGPPGGGKTMLARRLRGVLPSLTDEEAVEVALVHAAAGMRRGLTHVRPFRSPHHTASKAALVGGGSGIAVPGEASLAHRGVLFLDELAEFPRANLDTLRQPLEDGEVTVSRRGVRATFPSRFQLIGATNPCPCGFLGDRRKPCECRPASVTRYRQRLSGPLLDRFDLVVKVDRLDAAGRRTVADPTEVVRARVEDARDVLSGQMDLTPPAADLVDTALDSGLVTARGAARVRSVGSTVAALAGEGKVGVDHIAEALALRSDW